MSFLGAELLHQAGHCSFSAWLEGQQVATLQFHPDAAEGLQRGPTTLPPGPGQAPLLHLSSWKETCLLCALFLGPGS